MTSRSPYSVFNRCKVFFLVLDRPFRLTWLISYILFDVMVHGY